MRKSKVRVKQRVVLLVLMLVIVTVAYVIWFISPYLSFALKAGLPKVLLYPTSALVKSTDNIVTITLYAADTSVFRFDLKNKSIRIIRSPDKVGQISKAKGYYVIFTDQHRRGIDEASDMLSQLTDWRFILGRRRYITYIHRLESDLKKNLTIQQLFALWRTYYFNKGSISIVTE